MMCLRGTMVGRKMALYTSFQCNDRFHEAWVLARCSRWISACSSPLSEDFWPTPERILHLEVDLYAYCGVGLESIQFDTLQKAQLQALILIKKGCVNRMTIFRDIAREFQTSRQSKSVPKLRLIPWLLTCTEASNNEMNTLMCIFKLLRHFLGIFRSWISH